MWNMNKGAYIIGDVDMEDQHLSILMATEYCRDEDITSSGGWMAWEASLGETV